MINHLPQGSIYIEFRDIHDGWSVVKLPSGEFLNRWHPTKQPEKWAATEKAIKRLRDGDLSV